MQRPTILCNLCMVEDLENGKVILNTAPERLTGLYARWPYRRKENLVESAIREIYEETGFPNYKSKTGRSQDGP